MRDDGNRYRSSWIERVRVSEAAVAALFVAMDDSSVLICDSRDANCDWKVAPIVQSD